MADVTCKFARRGFLKANWILKSDRLKIFLVQRYYDQVSPKK
jgi:hypothetical protein